MSVFMGDGIIEETWKALIDKRVLVMNLVPLIRLSVNFCTPDFTF